MGNTSLVFAEQCQTDADCSIGYRCIGSLGNIPEALQGYIGGGICYQACSTDAECGPTHQCNSQNICVVRSTPLQPDNYCYFIDWNNQCEDYVTGCQTTIQENGVERVITREECLAKCSIDSTITGCQFLDAQSASNVRVNNCTEARQYVESTIYGGTAPGSSAAAYEEGYVRVIVDGCEERATSCGCNVRIEGANTRDQQVDWRAHSVGDVDHVCDAQTEWFGAFDDTDSTYFDAKAFFETSIANGTFTTSNCKPITNSPLNNFSPDEVGYELAEVIAYSREPSVIVNQTRFSIDPESGAACSAETVGLFIVPVEKRELTVIGVSEYSCTPVIDEEPVEDSGYIPFSLPSTSGIQPLDRVTIPILIGRIIQILVGIFGSITLIMVVYGGALMMLGGTGGDKFKKGTSIILWSSLAFVVLIASYGIVQFIFQIIG